MVYQLPQTYPFACPQAKQMDSLSEGGLEIAGTHRLKHRSHHLYNIAFHI